jgi:TPP-dependent 2-oxoacid decarboxylase
MKSIADVLIGRLSQLGCGHVFGVPGDYVLDFMDDVIASELELVCTCNELNAGYAADAYARLRGIGAVCTTYGVGTFSLMNAVVGAYAECVPLVVISGSPRVQGSPSPLLLHHTTGDLHLQARILDQVTVAGARLDRPARAVEQIDEVLAACLRYKRPVYFEIPMDLATKKCIPEVRPLDRSAVGYGLNESVDLCDKEALAECVSEIRALLERAHKPVILAGVEIRRFQLESALQRLIEASGFGFATTLLGKSCVSEAHPQFLGTYVGALSRESVRRSVEDSDCVLGLGAIMTDVNLGVNTAQLSKELLITANSDQVRIKHHLYSPVSLGALVHALVGLFETQDFLLDRGRKVSLPFVEAETADPSGGQLDSLAGTSLTHVQFYGEFHKFLAETGTAGTPQTVIADTGDALISMIDLAMPGHTEFIGQAFYLSIGFSVPAALGVGHASRNARPVVVVGDGAFQMTVQELSSLIRDHINPVVFLINNDGYTIERVIQDNRYNDIQPWKYHALPAVFGRAICHEVRTLHELHDALNCAREVRDQLVFVEVHLGRLDCSTSLRRLGQAAQSAAAPRS